MHRTRDIPLAKVVPRLPVERKDFFQSPRWNNSPAKERKVQCYKRLMSILPTNHTNPKHKRKDYSKFENRSLALRMNKSGHPWLRFPLQDLMISYRPCAKKPLGTLLTP